MKKQIWIPVMAALLLTAALLIVLAAPSVSPSLRFEGTTAVAEVAVTAKKERIDITVTLLEAGKEEEQEAASWHLAGEGQVSLCERVEAVPGKTYTLTLTGTIGSRTLHVNPVSGRCPGEEAVETQPSEPETTEAADTQPEGMEPEETQPAATEPEETQPAETQPAETEPVETQKPAIYDEQFGSFSPLSSRIWLFVRVVFTVYAMGALSSTAFPS